MFFCELEIHLQRGSSGLQMNLEMILVSTTF